MGRIDWPRAPALVGPLSDYPSEVGRADEVCFRLSKSRTFGSAAPIACFRRDAGGMKLTAMNSRLSRKDADEVGALLARNRVYDGSHLLLYPRVLRITTSSYLGRTAIERLPPYSVYRETTQDADESSESFESEVSAELSSSIGDRVSLKAATKYTRGRRRSRTVSQARELTVVNESDTQTLVVALWRRMIEVRIEYLTTDSAYSGEDVSEWAVEWAPLRTRLDVDPGLPAIEKMYVDA